MQNKAHKTLLQICANDILNIFIHMEEIIELNTIRRIYLDNKELFKLLSEDINKNLDIVIKHFYLLYENPSCAKIYTNQIIHKVSSVTMDSMINEIKEYIDILPVYTYDSVANARSDTSREIDDINGEII